MYTQKRFTMGLLTLAVVLGCLVSCGGKGGDGTGDGGGGDTTPNPVASATGPDQPVLAGSLVTLDGSGSSNASTYAWSFTSWPGGGSAPSLSPSSVVSSPTFTAATAGSYQLSLLVGNGTKSSTDTVTITAIQASPISDTSQTKCYTADGIEMTCAGTGQDADYNDTNQPSYTDNGDETITDNVTGLMWQQCTMVRSGANCATGTLGAYTWYAASGTAEPTYNPKGATNVCGELNFATYTDWRLPTESELMSLADYSGSFTRAINDTYFPGTQISPYWSSTPYADTFANKAWYVVFTAGIVSSNPVTSLGRVRCVRGASSSPYFIDNGDGTVTDLAGSLMWQKCTGGQSGTDCAGSAATKTWVDAISYCEALSLGGYKWRLPNIKELRSIVDTAKLAPAVNNIYFPGTQGTTGAAYYWSSTTHPSLTGLAWTIDFNSGGMVQNIKGLATGMYVRCVRDK